MKFIYLFAIPVIVTICIITTLGIYSYQGNYRVDAKVTVNNSWQGDNAPYQNITLSYHGVTDTFVVNCDFFSHLTSYQVVFYPHGALGLGPDIAEILPKGCDRQ